MTASGDSVFIAYDLRDSDEAEALTAALEGQGLKVWLGWRDKAPAGNAADYAAQLRESAGAGGAFVLLLAGSAADLAERRDLTQRAYKAGKPIFVVRADEGAAVPDFPALLGVAARDAFGAQKDSNLAALAAAIGAALPPAAATPSAPAETPPAPAPQAPAPEAPVAPPIYANPPEPPATPPPYATPPAPAAAPPVYATAPAPPAAPPAYAAPPAPPAPPPATPVYAPPPAAPAHAAAPPPDDEQTQMLRTFVGQNADYYLRKWEEMRARNASTSWNWAAFLLSMFWLVSRRMFAPAGLFAGAFLLLQLAPAFTGTAGLAYLANGLTIGLAVWIGLNGNRLYRGHAERAVAQVRAIAPDPNARAALLQARGGVSIPLALGAALAWAVVVTGIFYVVAQQRYISHRYSSSSGTSARSVDSILIPGADGRGDGWLVGQWALTSAAAGPNCATWIRFNADHSLSDNVYSTGTWSLAGGDSNYVLTMTSASTGTRSVPVIQATDGTITMGSIGNTVRWQRATC